MTSSGGRPRVPRRNPGEYPRARTRLVDLIFQGQSTRAATRQLRAEGYRIGNDQARAIANLVQGNELTKNQARAIGLNNQVRIGKQSGNTRTVKVEFDVTATVNARFPNRNKDLDIKDIVRSEAVNVPIINIIGKNSLQRIAERHIENMIDEWAKVNVQAAGYAANSPIIDVGVPEIKVKGLDKGRAPYQRTGRTLRRP